MMALRKKEENVATKVALGSAIAGVAGYLAGLLTAPKSGKQTRKEIAKTAGSIKDDTEDQLQNLNTELKELIKTTKVKTVALSSTARAEFNEAVVKAKDAQNKSAQVLKAAKAGEASDPDLNKAVKQARQAIKNLSKYLKS
ncbi:MAG TPA: YtxH domain-containing protein [Candidatus Saccharimonadales bacterium]|nr:YtxH domain-containing protein [Candidatus Saccharimonadales bacterium]